MSDTSSREGAWSTRLAWPRRPELLFERSDDPRLGQVFEFWSGDPAALTPGRAVVLGFPQDEGVRRNHGRAGAAEAPHAIRQFLHRLTPCDASGGVDLTDRPPLDVGDLRCTGSLEDTQHALGEVLGAILRAGAIPIVLGGGHETAWGHYLGYVNAQRPVGIINIDAHLDIRPCTGEQGHSGSPFRQALEHPTAPLPGAHYVCLGAQPHSVSRQHAAHASERGCVVRWCGQVRNTLQQHFAGEAERLAGTGCAVYVTLDADAVQAGDVPGVSAPNPIGLAGAEVLACARRAGGFPAVTSLDLVEINPRLDRDGQSARWGALVVWQFLMGLAGRPA